MQLFFKLSFLGADFVTAFESFEPMADIASQTLLDNSVSQSQFDVITACSKDVKLNQLKFQHHVNLVVAEIFDSALIGEGCLSTFIHVNEELMKNENSNFKFVPHAAKTFVVPFQSNFLRGMFNVDEKFGESFFGSYFDDVTNCPGIATPLELQFSYLINSPVLRNDFIALSEPIEVFDFEFGNLSSENLNEFKTVEFEVKVHGRVDGVMLYWTLIMNEEFGEADESNMITTSPFLPILGNQNFLEYSRSSPWREHWMQTFYNIQNNVEVSKGEKLTLNCEHDEYNLWFDVSKTNESLESEEPTQFEPNLTLRSNRNCPACECGVHVCLNRNRLLLTQSSNYFEKWQKCLKTANLKAKTVLLLGNFNLFFDLLTAENVKEIIVLENNTLCLKTLKRALKNRDVDCNVRTRFVTNISEVETSSVDFIIGEPYFMSAELPWHHAITFGQLSRNLILKSPKEVTIFPSKAILKCAFGRTAHLHRIRERVKSDIHGINLDAFNGVIQMAQKSSFANVESHYLFEYETYFHSDVISVHEFNFDDVEFNKEWNFELKLDDYLSSNYGSERNMPAEYETNCLFLWMEYCVDYYDKDLDLGSEITFSEGPLKNDNGVNRAVPVDWNPVYKQAVCWFDCKLVCKININYSSHDQEINIVFSD